MKYEPTQASLSAHAIPDWYNDSKLGIFIHWGLYSIPGFAVPGDETLSLNNLDFAEMPYSEWYYNKLRIKDSTTKQYHEKKYGKNFQYYDFAKIFEEQSKNFRADNWAELFQKAGAKYVVLTTKHHDGYLLWPSKYKNPKVNDYYSKRDLVGEVTEKVRARGMKMGLYYSGVLDWSINTVPMKNYITFLENLRQGDEYLEYAENHYYELIERYSPSVLWNDIGYPYGYDLNKLFAFYYNSVPEGVINNRWKQSKIPKWLINPAAKGLVNKILSTLVKHHNPDKALEQEEIPGLHTDFSTPEYASFKTIRDRKFESTRGIGHSFAYNHMEDASHMLTGKELIHMLIDVVSKNGNLLINVGPMADGTIPAMQEKPLLEMGKWLNINGCAIYGTRPWKQAEGKTAAGQDVRFTVKNEKLYVILLDSVEDPSITIRGLHLPSKAKIKLIGNLQILKWENSNIGAIIYIPRNAAGVSACACAFEIMDGASADLRSL